jgi:hypothetical protein
MGAGLVGRSEIARSLTEVSADEFAESTLLWLSHEMPAQDLQRILGQSPAGQLFADMKVAEEIARARRQDHERRNDPEFVKLDRARKKAERAAAHQERLAAKALRDASRKSNS